MYGRYNSCNLPTYLSIHVTSLSAGAAAESAAVRKTVKYADLITDYIFLPLTFESPIDLISFYAFLSPAETLAEGGFHFQR